MTRRMERGGWTGRGDKGEGEVRGLGGTSRDAPHGTRLPAGGLGTKSLETVRRLQQKSTIGGVEVPVEESRVEVRRKGRKEVCERGVGRRSNFKTEGGRPQLRNVKDGRNLKKTGKTAVCRGGWTWSLVAESKQGAHTTDVWTGHHERWEAPKLASPVKVRGAKVPAACRTR